MGWGAEERTGPVQAGDSLGVKRAAASSSEEGVSSCTFLPQKGPQQPGSTGSGLASVRGIICLEGCCFGKVTTMVGEAGAGLWLEPGDLALGRRPELTRGEAHWVECSL